MAGAWLLVIALDALIMGCLIYIAHQIVKGVK